MRRHTIVAIAAGALVVLSACGSDETTSAAGSSTSPGQSVCDAMGQLKGSVETLGDVSIEPGVVAQLQDTAQQIKEDATALRQAAGEQFSSELGAFESAVQGFGDDVQAAASDPSAAALSTLGADLGEVQDAWEALKGAVPDCDL